MRDVMCGTHAVPVALVLVRRCRWKKAAGTGGNGQGGFAADETGSMSTDTTGAVTGAGAVLRCGCSGRCARQQLHATDERGSRCALGGWVVWHPWGELCWMRGVRYSVGGMYVGD